MTTRSRIALAVHRVALSTSRTPLGRLWALAYWLIARLGAIYLAWGEKRPTAYTRGSLRTDDFLPGLSDVDLTIVLGQDPSGPNVARERAERRWQRLRRAFPLTDLLLDYPRICEQPELVDLNDASALTYGLDVPGESRAGYFGTAANPDRARMLERPGLYGATADWRLLSGPDRRPPEPDRDPQLSRIAGWLELVHWWQWVFPVCVDPKRPRTAHLCLKLVTEPVRVWLWLAHGERASGRDEVLDRALRRMPEEEDGLRRAVDLGASLPELPDPPLDEVVPLLVRVSARIAALIGTQVEPAGTTEVRLVGADAAELVLAHGGWRPTGSLPGGRDPSVLPLCDWRSMVCHRRPDQAFATLPGDPGDPAVLAAAASSQNAGPYPALRADGLMVLPATPRVRSRLRAVQCAATDPVSFALARGDKLARFPDVRGWSAGDTAGRAVAEHRAWIESEPSDDGDALGMLIAAARAALFHESLRSGGTPVIHLTVVETLRQLANRSREGRAVAGEALECYREFARDRTQPPPDVSRAMRGLVRALPAYADAR